MFESVTRLTDPWTHGSWLSFKLHGGNGLTLDTFEERYIHI